MSRHMEKIKLTLVDPLSELCQAWKRQFKNLPMPITQTDNVYKAMWAMLLAVHKHNQQKDTKIKIVACPGLGTLTGNVPADEAARQMALAYRNYLWPLEQINWPYAQTRQNAIGYGGDPLYNK